MSLLDVFNSQVYPNDLGPGVDDIHSLNVLKVALMVGLIEKAQKYISLERLWANPDCSLKTRMVTKTKLALENMVIAAKILRYKMQ